MLTKRFILILSATTALALAAVACGGGASSDAGDHSAGTDAQPPGSDSTTSRNSLESALGLPAQPKAMATATGGAAGTAPSTEDAYGTVQSAASQLDRKIIFNAKVDVASNDVQSSFADVSRIARTAGGFVDKSSVYNKKDDSGEERTYATITLRVPVAAYQDTLQSLRTLPGGKVLKEESSSREVTDQYTDLNSRLRNLQQSETQYLKLMEQAKTIQDIMAVSDRIDGIRLQSGQCFRSANAVIRKLVASLERSHRVMGMRPEIPVRGKAGIMLFQYHLEMFDPFA